MRAGPTAWSSWNAGEIDPYDSRTAALAFAEAFRALAPDLVLVGVQTPVRRLRSDRAGARRRSSAGRRRTSSSASPWPTGPRAWCRSTPAAGSRCWAFSCRPSSGVQSASSPPRYVSMGRLRQAMTEASAETLDVSVEAPSGAPKLVVARPPGAAGPVRRCSRAMPSRWPRRSSRCCANGERW